MEKISHLHNNVLIRLERQGLLSERRQCQRHEADNDGEQQMERTAVVATGQHPREQLRHRW